VEKIVKIRAQIRGFLAFSRPFTLHFAAVGIAIALGAGVGLVKAMGAPPKLANVDRWALPQWKPFQAAAARQELATSAVFTQDPAKRKADLAAAAAAAALASAAAWRFTGTVQEGDHQIALIEVDKGMHIRRILPGDELPGGAKVTAVHVGELDYTDSAGERVLHLFGDKKDSPVNSHKNQ